MSMSHAAADDKILSYHDAVLRRSDLTILRNPHFINDRIIEFFFAHLSPPPSVLLVPPSISFWISHCPDPQDSLAPLHLPSRSLAFFPVNDNQDPALAEGGSHWSLLVYDRTAGEFVHHDSIAGANRRHAERLYMKVRRFVGGDGEGEVEVGLVEGPTPKQKNGYDCGVYVMAIARVICEWYEGRREEEGRWFGRLMEEVDAAAVESLRGEILRLILSLMEKK